MSAVPRVIGPYLLWNDDMPFGLLDLSGCANRLLMRA